MNKVAKREGCTFETRTAGDLARDIDWLVDFQIYGKTYREIVKAASISTSEDAVRKAVERLAQLLQLKPRRSQRGRPRTQTPPRS